jgi:hypothetical protein
MPSIGYTGTCGWTNAEITKFQDTPIPKNVCDVCKKKQATHWFGMTSVITCGSTECVEIMQSRFDAWASDIDAQRIC